MEYHVYPLKLFVRKVPVLSMLGGALALNIFSWLWLLLQIPRDLEQVFLHYNILFGVDKIGESGEVYYASLIGLALLVANFITAWILYKKDWFLAYLLLAIAMMVNLFVAISSVLIVFLNI